MADVIITINYEIYDGLPVLRKWITITLAPTPSTNLRGGGVSDMVVVDTLNYEMLRAPNMAPEHMTLVLQQANNPTPWDQQVVVNVMVKSLCGDCDNG